MPPPATLTTLRDAATRLGTYPKRVRDLVDETGVEPIAVGPSLALTEEQFEVIARHHAANPPRPRGNPGWLKPRRPRPT